MLKGEERKDVLGVRVAEVLEADPPSDQPIIKRFFCFFFPDFKTLPDGLTLDRTAVLV